MASDLKYLASLRVHNPREAAGLERQERAFCQSVRLRVHVSAHAGMGAPTCTKTPSLRRLTHNTFMRARTL